MAKRTNWVAWGLLSVLTVTVLGGCSLVERGGILNPRRVRYLIPDGYVGWVQVLYDVPNAPLIPQEDGRELIRVPASGVFRTSAHQGLACEQNEYFYVSGTHRRRLEETSSGGGGMIWAHHIATPELATHPELAGSGFYVGTEAQYKEDWFLRDKPSKIAMEFYTFGRLCGKEDGSRGFDEFSENTNTPPRREIVGGGKTQTYLAGLAGGIPGTSVARQKRQTDHEMAEAYRLYKLLAASGPNSGDQYEYVRGFKTGYGIEQLLIRISRRSGHPLP